MLRLLFVTTEIDDFVRTGGLAAVSAALPRVLRSWSDTRILLPGYGEVVRRLHNLRIVGKCEPLGAMPACDIGAGETADGLPFYVVICPQLYERPGTPYVDENGRDWPDNDIRFARLASVAASLAAGHLDPAWRADVVHLNDWQSALAPAYLSWNGARIPSVLTIHNLAFQGLFERETLYRIGAPESAFHIEGLEFYGKVSFLKAGLQYATHLTTVSETYAREITLPEFGCGLDGVLRKRAANGESLLGSSTGSTIAGIPKRARNWPHHSHPAIGRESTLIKVTCESNLAWRYRAVRGLAWSLASSTRRGSISFSSPPRPSSNRAAKSSFWAVAKPKSRRPCARFRPNIRGRSPYRSASKTEKRAASSPQAILPLLPSRFEPCGLSQMYAQRFGSLPIGRKTGGLAETIKDGQTGFLFPHASTESFMGAVCRAFGAFADYRRLNIMRSGAMAQEFQWSRPAASYQSLYQKVCSLPC